MIELQIPFNTTAEWFELRLGDTMVQHHTRLIPEVQAWVNDGRVVDYVIHSSHILGRPHLNRFKFHSLSNALQFKLIFG